MDPQPTEPHQSPAPPRRRRLWRRLVLAALVIGALGAGGAWLWSAGYFDSEAMAWRAAERDGSPAAFNRFLANHGGSEHKDEALKALAAAIEREKQAREEEERRNAEERARKEEAARQAALTQAQREQEARDREARHMQRLKRGETALERVRINLATHEKLLQSVRETKAACKSRADAVRKNKQAVNDRQIEAGNRSHEAYKRRAARSFGCSGNCNNGRGTYYYNDGGLYQGDFRYGRRDGQGVYLYPDGGRYNGGHLSGQRSGFGRLEYPDGSYMEGQWSYNQYASGKALIIYRNGSWFDGELDTFGDVESGTKVYTDGARFTGKFNNKKIENGTFEYTDGAIYTGSFNYSENRSGEGTMIYNDGGYYKGEWSSGERHGKGYVVFPDGGEYSGEFKYNKLNGHGERLYPDGTLFVGEFKDGSCTFGEQFLTDGTSRKGRCAYGDWLGDVTRYDSYGDPVAVETWSSGKVASSRALK